MEHLFFRSGGRRGRLSGRLQGILFCFLLFCFGGEIPVWANNVSLPGIVTVKEVDNTLGIATLNFELSWDNSWRDVENFDGVWLFLKYKQTGSGVWQHGRLVEKLFQVQDTAGARYTVYQETPGAMLYRQQEGHGRVRIVSCQLEWQMPEEMRGVSKDVLNGPDYLLVVQGIEMVLVPNGPFYAGDGASEKSFCDEANQPFSIVTEEEVTLGLQEGSSVSVSADFPKGYAPFWCMKYEASQEQVVSFLNMLPGAQQNEVLALSASPAEGVYVFAGGNAVEARNGIIVAQTGDDGVVFDCNVNGNADYGEDSDGKTLACNFMTPLLLRGFASWAGLRPMSELEYEKACRPLYPAMPAEGEFAWNSNATLSGLTAVATVSNGGTEREIPVSGNVNYGANFGGPVRCGAFAARNGGQLDAGGSYWGVMEMSGNVAEICAVVAHTSFNRNVQGEGTYNPALWRGSNDYRGFVPRGGGFNSTQQKLRVSDRSDSEISSWQKNDKKNCGFRCVRNYAGSESVSLAPLGCFAERVVCNGGAVELYASPASLRSGNTTIPADFLYSWYVSRDGQTFTRIPGQEELTLNNYTLTNEGETAAVYYFRLRAMCAFGDAYRDDTIRVVGTNLRLTSAVSAGIDACRLVGGEVQAAGHIAGGTYEWSAEGRLLAATGNSYTLKFGEVTDTVWCVHTTDEGSCSSRGFYVLPTHTDVRYSYTDTRPEGNNESYPMVKIGTQCWMKKNMNVGTMVSGDNYETHLAEGIQRICYDNNLANCTKYGGLYNWYETVNGENLSSAADTVNYKYSPGGTTMVQGICPDGFHVPSDDEWKTLERFLGMTEEEVNKENAWRGTDQGTRMKASGTYEGTVWCSGSDCNSSGLSLLPGGFGLISNGRIIYGGLGGHSGLWTSIREFDVARERYLLYTHSSVHRYWDSFLRSYSVRCLRD